MDISLKRIIAFLLDILIVSSFTSIIIKFTPIDVYKEKYEKVFNEYTEIMESLDKDNKLVKQYENKLYEINYKLYKYRVISSSVSVVSLLLYFGIIQMFMDGETVGKKIMNLKVVSNDEKKKLSVGNYLIRTVLLTNALITIISIILVYIVKGKTFYYITYVLSLLQYISYFTSILFITLRKDKRGFHDILGGTKVIDIKPVVNESVEEVKKESIKEKVDKKENKKKKH